MHQNKLIKLLRSKEFENNKNWAQKHVKVGKLIFAKIAQLESCGKSSLDNEIFFSLLSHIFSFPSIWYIKGMKHTPELKVMLVPS